MRIILFLALATILTMCKTKDKIEENAPIVYTVLLQKDASPKKLLKVFQHVITDYNKTSKTENQWRMIFRNEGAKSEMIKRDLLNNDLIVRVYDGDNSGPVNTKNSKKGKSTIKKQ